LERDVENSDLAGNMLEAGPVAQLMGSSITCRTAVGPQKSKYRARGDTGQAG
jgi:hypothetical protein